MSVADAVEPGRLRQAPPPEAVMTTAEAVVVGASAAPDRADLRTALGKEQERAQDLVAYVRARSASDHRAAYNLACFEARLAGRVAAHRDVLLERAEADLAQARRDPKLAEWAQRDPALAVLRLAGTDPGAAPAAPPMTPA
jgi:hypothetical protein